MKRVLLSVLFLIIALIVAKSVSACEITFEEGDKVKAEGRKAKITVVVKWEHRKCVLADDDINIDYNGVKKLKESGWRKERAGLFKNEIEVELMEKEGEVRVWRECSKKGISEGKVKILE